MGSYNSQYESYYSKMYGKKNTNYYNTKRNSSKKNKSFTFDGIVKRVIAQLIIVLLLFSMIIICKMFINPYTRYIYTYSKQTINNNYDYSSMYSNIKKMNFNQLQSDAINYIEELRVKITGGQTIKDEIQNFSWPVDNINNKSLSDIASETKVKKNSNGADIFTPSGTKVKAVYEGTIKDNGQDEKLGKYIIIDHGNGIESKYSNLSEVKVSKGDTVKTGEEIAISKVSQDTNEDYVHFELFYMGKNEDPFEYMKI
jgi:Membrane proteins related to metalloendopeptidases